MPSLVNKLDTLLYPAHAANWDDAWFRELILRYMDSESQLLDLGAGAGIVPQMNLRGRGKRICGVDPDPRVMQNPYLDDACIGVGEAIPYDSETFDLLFADNVLEHLEHPEHVFNEAMRVLKPGGLFLAKTPNKWHYVPTLARLTPHAFHQWVNRRRGREADDTFPTHYLANTPAAITRYATKCGFEVAEIHLVEGRPEYLRFSWPTYLCGWIYERMVNHVPGLSCFRVVLGVVLRKPGSAACINSTFNTKTRGDDSGAAPEESSRRMAAGKAA